MANVITVGRNTIQITGLDDDWVMGTNTNFDFLRVTGVTFVPSAAEDRMILHEDGGIDDAAFYDSGLVPSDDAVSQSYDPPRSVKIALDISDCVVGTPANAKLLIHFV